MKRSFAKIISVVLSLMFALTAFSCLAAAETTVVKCNCCLNNSGSAGDTITKFQGDRDIYLVLDISGSMSGEPMKKLKDAAKEFCKKYLLTRLPYLCIIHSVINTGHLSVYRN